MIFNIILFTDINIQTLDTEALKELLIEDPDIIDFEVTLNESDNIFKNQFYELDGFNPKYEERNIVAEDEILNLTLGDVNSFECLDNNETIDLMVNYSGSIKTEDETMKRNITLDLEFQLRQWR